MRRQRPVLLVVGAVACLAACSRPVELDSPSLDSATAEACQSFVDELPQRVGDQDRRDVEGRFGAAYGDPAIVVLCGVPEPEELATQCMSVDGVDWAVDEDDDSNVRALTFGREPLVEVRVPAVYGSSAAALVDVGPLVEEHTRRRGGC